MYWSIILQIQLSEIKGHFWESWELIIYFLLVLEMFLIHWVQTQVNTMTIFISIW